MVNGVRRRRRRRRRSGSGEAKGRGAANGGGGRKLGFTRSEAEARVGLFTAAGALVEDGAVNLGNDDVVAEAEVDGRSGGKREGVEFR